MPSSPPSFSKHSILKPKVNSMATLETPHPDDRFLSQPKEIIYNILLRLPVKTLLILQSVCKTLLSLVSSTDFVETQLSVSTNDLHFTHHCLMLGEWTYELPCDVPCLHFSTCSVYSLLHDPFTEYLSLDDECLIIFRNIVGTCNGLLVGKDCVESNKLSLWNPSTGEINLLPELHWICFMPSTNYGFGYDKLNDDYKIFAISPAHPDYNVHDPSRTHCEYKVFMYSLKSDCWRMIGDFPYQLLLIQNEYTPAFNDGKFANGSIYWNVIPVQMQTEKIKDIIVALDVTTETFREVLRPDFGNNGGYKWTLGTFGESLSALCQFEHTRADFWIMKECGAEVSWTKLFTIPYTNELINWCSYLNPICMTVNGDIMLHLDSTIVLYSSKDHTFMNLSAPHEFAELYVYPYVETLVSPHLYSDTDDE